MTPRTTEVLVIGAGPAGEAAAVALARAGREVTVLDAARFPRDKTCGDALSNNAVDEIAAMGAGAALDATPHTIVRGALAILPGGHAVRRSYGAHAGRIVPRLALDAILREAAERAGARVVEGARVRDLIVDRGRVVGARGDAGDIAARAVIAADGHGSVAWKVLGEPRARTTLAVSATAYFEGVAPLGEGGFSEHHFDRAMPCGYGWIFPPVEGVSNVGVYQRADAYRRGGRSLSTLLDAFLAAHADRFRDARQVGKRRVWPLPLVSRRSRSGCAGLLTCGDAGHHIDALTGEGIWQALLTGRMAGEAAAAALATGDLDDAAVRRYRAAIVRRVDAVALARRGVQDALDLVLRTGLDRTSLVRRALAWGYGSGSLEVSKVVARA